jgi:cytochrome c oxidase subunit 2
VHSITNSFINKNLLAAQTVEWLWTLIPAILLTQIAVPSLLLLYMIEEPNIGAQWNIKVTGRQWFWSYNIDNSTSLRQHPFEFDSYIVSGGDENNLIRLLDVDNRIRVPMTHVNVTLRSSDVIHSWTVPTLGVKRDCIPGRLNDLSFTPQRPGVFYGQCSEICGANHRFIPIVINIIKLEDIFNYTLAQLEESISEA